MKGLSSSPPGASPYLGLDTLRVTLRFPDATALTRPPALSPPRLCTCKPKGIYVHLCGISACLCPMFVMFNLEFTVVILMDFYQRETSHFTLLVSC